MVEREGGEQELGCNSSQQGGGGGREERGWKLSEIEPSEVITAVRQPGSSTE